MLGMKNHFDISGSIEIREVDIAGVACTCKYVHIQSFAPYKTNWIWFKHKRVCTSLPTQSYVMYHSGDMYVKVKTFFCSILLCCRQAVHQNFSILRSLVTLKWDEGRVSFYDLSVHFLTWFLITVTIQPHIQADHHVLRKQFKTCCDHEKISRSPDARNLVCVRVMYSLNSGRCTTHCFRYIGKIDTVCQFKTCVTLKIQSKSQIWSAFYLALKLYSC